MSVTRDTAITGQNIVLTITFREDGTEQLFDPFKILQVDILQPDGQTVIQTIASGGITRLSIGVYQITINAVASPGIVLDRWMYQIEDGGVILTSIESTNVAPAPILMGSVESLDALPRHSAVILRPILLSMEFRDSKTGELYDPFQVRQVQILDQDQTTILQTITSITRIGIGVYRVQANMIQTPRTIYDEWFFTNAQGEPEQVQIKDTQVYDQAILGGVVTPKTVPERIFSDVGATSIEIVRCGSVKNVAVTFQDSTGTAINPEALSLSIIGMGGSVLLTDTYLPASSRNPDPPRILNPSPGRFEFPFGLDNGSKVRTAVNRTDMRQDFLFVWNAASRAAVTAAVTIAPPGSNTGLVWTAVATGTPGNFINIAYVNPGTPNALLTITRTGSVVTVSLATDNTSTPITVANDVIAAFALNTNASAAAIVTPTLASGSTGVGVLSAVAATFLVGGIDASEELVVNENVSIITTREQALLPKLRMQIDKAQKMVDVTDPDDPVLLGYTDGQLLKYIRWGLNLINAYQPTTIFSPETYPYDEFEFMLVECAILAGVAGQELFAVDTDIPSWNDQGNAFVIQHQPQLSAYLNWLTSRLDKLIPIFKLNFVNSGNLHVQMGPNFRLATLLSAAPTGSLFRNMFLAPGG